MRFQVVAIFASEARMKRIDLRVEFGRDLQTAIKTDHVRLGQVITNLVSNAIKFTATSETRRITVRVDSSFEPPSEENCVPPIVESKAKPGRIERDVPVWIFVCVEDTGPGLPPLERAALFRRFSRELTKGLLGRATKYTVLMVRGSVCDS
jgi:signal transduction histidine kinase